MEISTQHNNAKQREAYSMLIFKVWRGAGLTFAPISFGLWVAALNFHLSSGSSFADAITKSAVFFLMALSCMFGSGSAKRDIKILELKREIEEMRHGSKYHS